MAFFWEEWGVGVHGHFSYFCNYWEGWETVAWQGQ
jgi:hypothetical protein